MNHQCLRFNDYIVFRESSDARLTRCVIGRNSRPPCPATQPGGSPQQRAASIRFGKRPLRARAIWSRPEVNMQNYQLYVHMCEKMYVIYMNGGVDPRGGRQPVRFVLICDQNLVL